MAQHLRAWLAYGRPEGELFYWRTRSGVEVDFVIYGVLGFLGDRGQERQASHS